MLCKLKITRSYWPSNLPRQFNSTASVSHANCLQDGRRWRSKSFQNSRNFARIRKVEVWQSNRCLEFFLQNLFSTNLGTLHWVLSLAFINFCPKVLFSFLALTRARSISISNLNVALWSLIKTIGQPVKIIVY